MTTPLDAALTYAARGWRVVPIGPGTKWPDLAAWQERATTDPATIAEWFTSNPGRGVGIATGEGSGVFVLDVDTVEGKVGAESLAELEAAHGPLPVTVEAVTGSGGRHLFYRHPPGLDLSNSAGRLGPDLDIRANGGQVVAEPTPHPTTGQPYAFDLEHHPDDMPVADAPAWLLRLLEPPPKVDAGPRGTFEQARLAWDRFNYRDGIDQFVAAMLTAEAGWTEGRPDRSGARYFTRPGKRHGIGATLGKVAPGVLYCFTSSAPPFEAERSYDPADVFALIRFAGDRAAADAELVAQGWGLPSWSITSEAIAAWITERQAAQAPTERSSRWLPDDFWQARPHLTHIRQAARSRLLSPDAVLGAVLTRVAVLTPHTVELPPTVGTPCGLTFYAAIVGTPSMGKSTAADLAATILPGDIKRRAIGSGEGFIDTMFDLVTETGEDGKKRTTKQQTRYAALFHVDEGSTLAKLGNRSGATIMESLRTAFTHGVLGQENASLETRRHLPGEMYVYGVTIGIQPDKAGELLGDGGAGTPQRFAWFMASDPTAPTVVPPWPEPLNWSPPVTQLEQVRTVRGSIRHELGLHPSIVDEVIADRQAVMSGQAEEDEGDAHRNLMRLKIAALLALLDGRAGVVPDDWSLAGVVVDTSRRVRRGVEEYLAKAAASQAQARHRARAEGEVVVAEALENRALSSAAKRAARAVARHFEETSTPANRTLISSTSNSKARGDAGGLDAIIAEAVARDWIVPAGDGWTPGPSRPA